MLLGAMNHPMANLHGEIEWIAKQGFDFIDLTLEPEQATPTRLNAVEIRQQLADTGLFAIGHTAHYLPLPSPIPELKDAAFSYFYQCLDLFAEIGVKLVNIHPYTRISLYGREWVAQRHVEILREIIARAASMGLKMMLENVPPHFNQPHDLKPIFHALPELGFHLDVGHANLDVPVNITGKLLADLAPRLAHVHINDNVGGREDLHLPLGAGRINWPWVARILQRRGYNGTVTLEVFSPDREYLLISKTKWLKIWEESLLQNT
jgi:sugar phosphate isomerase/epimerase